MKFPQLESKKTIVMIRNYISIFVCFTAWVLTSCSPKVTSNILHKEKPQESLDDVVMLKEKEPLPADAEWMGSVSVKGKAGYDRMAEMTRFEAWQKGGKYVKVKHYGSDGVRSDIHVMNSDVYKADTAKANPKNVRVIDSGGNVLNVNAAATSSVNEAVEITPWEKTGTDNVKVFVGYGRRMNKISPDLDLFQREHIKRLLNGVMFGAEYIQYFNRARGSGLGLRYQIMHGSSADAATMTYENGTTVDGVLDESVNISFMGPVYSGRWVSGNVKHQAVANVGLGLMLWNDVQTFNDEKLVMRGKTLGVLYELNYSYLVNEHIALGADVSLTSGVLKKVNATDGEKTETYMLEENQYEGLAHLGVCAQILFTF